MKMIKKITTALLFGAMSVSAFSFLINDITFDQEIGGNGYKEYKITNDGGVKNIYKVSIIPLDNPKAFEGVTVYPKVLPVEANSSATLKIFGGDKAEVPEGEYRFMLSFKPIVVPTLKKEKDSGKIAGTVGAGIVPDIEMMGHVGYIDYSQSLKISNLKFTKDKDGKIVATYNIDNISHGGITVGALYYDDGKNISYSERVGRIPAKGKVPVKMELRNFTGENEVGKIQLYYTNGDKVVVLMSYDVKSGKYEIIEKQQ